MKESWLSVISIVLWIVGPVGIFITRHWIAAFITQGFNRRIEELQQILSLIGSTAPTDFQQLKNVERDEQPFITELGGLTLEPTGRSCI
jgi:hypothetical protein